MIQRGRAQQHGCEVDFQISRFRVSGLGFRVYSLLLLGWGWIFTGVQHSDKLKYMTRTEETIQCSKSRIRNRVASRRVVSRRDHIVSLVLVRLDLQNRSFLFSKPNKKRCKNKAND